MRMHTLFAGLVALSLAMPVMVGCDNAETLERDTEVDVKDDGTVVTETEKTTRQEDGTIKKVEEKSVEQPE